MNTTDHFEDTRAYILQNVKEQTNHQDCLKYDPKCFRNQKMRREGKCAIDAETGKTLKCQPSKDIKPRGKICYLLRW